MTRTEPSDAVAESGSPAAPPLGQALGKGLAWSLLNNVVSRLGTFLAGIVVVRILSPQDYGIYAVGMVVLVVLLSMNELGVSVAIVQRRSRIDDIAPTVATISIAASAAIAAAGFVAAPFIAHILNTPQAAGLIRLLLVGVVIDGITAVPNGLITRAFDQRTRLKIDLIAFAVGTPLTIGLALGGAGAWSLGWGTVAGNVVSLALTLRWAPQRVRPGWSRSAASDVLSFGLPLAGASMLLLVMLNVDYLVVGHVLGPAQLGFYLLAFNLCSWPITVISVAIRRVALAAFSRMSIEPGGGRDGFTKVVALVVAGTVPLCVLLAGYAGPIVGFLYGDKWLPAADAVRFLAVLSAGRIAVELIYDFLAAVGRPRSTLWLHGGWLVALVPTLVYAAHRNGITGVAQGHATVMCVVVLPLICLLLHRAGVRLGALARQLLLPLLGAGLLGVTMWPVLAFVSGYAAQIAVGGTAGLLLYLLIVSPMRRTAVALWNLPATAPPVDDRTG
jgi:O-antigen/teichoic acid export membrane protein